MPEQRIIAQVMFTGTLFEDGTLVIGESGTSYVEGPEPRRYQIWHDVEGTCEPEELAARVVEVAQTDL